MENERIGVGGDLPLKEIARAWSKVSGDNPEMLTAALVTAFWRGDFESEVRSPHCSYCKSRIRRLRSIPPASNVVSNSNLVSSAGHAGRAIMQAEGKSFLRWARMGSSNPTAERKWFYISREHIARMFYTPRGQRRIMQGESADFEGWSFEKRDLADPNWRAKYEDFYRALSTIPIEQWSSVPYDMRDHCSLWRIRRHDFARWYRASTLCAGVPLEKFWPHHILQTDRAIWLDRSLLIQNWHQFAYPGNRGASTARRSGGQLRLCFPKAYLTRMGARE